MLDKRKPCTHFGIWSTSVWVSCSFLSKDVPEQPHPTALGRPNKDIFNFPVISHVSKSNLATSLGRFCWNFFQVTHYLRGRGCECWYLEYFWCEFRFKAVCRKILKGALMPQDNSDSLQLDKKLDPLHLLTINCGVGRFLFLFFLWNQGIFKRNILFLIQTQPVK